MQRGRERRGKHEIAEVVERNNEDASDGVECDHSENVSRWAQVALTALPRNVGAMARALTVMHIDTERGWRGGERQLFWLAREMHRLGHHALVAARPGELLATRVSAAGIEVVVCNPGGELALRPAWRLLAAVPLSFGVLAPAPT